MKQSISIGFEVFINYDHRATSHSVSDLLQCCKIEGQLFYRHLVYQGGSNLSEWNRQNLHSQRIRSIQLFNSHLRMLDVSLSRVSGYSQRKRGVLSDQSGTNLFTYPLTSKLTSIRSFYRQFSARWEIQYFWGYTDNQLLYSTVSLNFTQLAILRFQCTKLRNTPIQSVGRCWTFGNSSCTWCFAGTEILPSSRKVNLRKRVNLSHLVNYKLALPSELYST